MIIKNIHLDYFKCFSNTDISLTDLTLLTGFNATGKSSVLQSLLLLNQSMQENVFGKELVLNGDWANLGVASNIIDNIHGKNTITLGLSTTKCKVVWDFNTLNRNSVTIPLDKVNLEDLVSYNTELISASDKKLLFRNLIPDTLRENFITSPIVKSLKRSIYISAERIGPRETYIISQEINKLGVGIKGEYTPWFLYENQTKAPLKSLQLNELPPTLLKQTIGWLGKFFPGTEIQLLPVEGANLITMRIRTNESLDFNRPQNVGYGITQVLPILVACLASNPGQLLIIENPESHLHPSGQSLMGEFLARCASTGVQIILESHSDHILNGIRKATKKKIIDSKNVTIHFFKQRGLGDKSNTTQINTLLIDNNGNLDNWPKGFFDQLEKDMEYFLGY